MISRVDAYSSLANIARGMVRIMMLKFRKMHIFWLLIVMLLVTGCGHAAIENVTDDMQESEASDTRNSDEETEPIGGVETMEYYTYYTSVLSKDLEYRLACSDPAAGMMSKQLEISKDDGESWETVEDLSDTIHNYPCDMCFVTEKEGIVLTDYHSVREYVYYTDDGGKSWTGMYPGEDDDIYSNGVSVTYDAEKDIVTIRSTAKISEDDVFEEREYESMDHGKTWE